MLKALDARRLLVPVLLVEREEDFAAGADLWLWVLLHIEQVTLRIVSPSIAAIVWVLSILHLPQ